MFFLACALLALAPVLRGGNRQIALAGLLALSAALLALLLGSLSFDRWWGRPPPTGERRKTARRGGLGFALALAFVGGSPLWLGLLQLSPLSAQAWSGLAGHDLYLGALAAAGGAAPQSLPLSLNPQATATALLSGVPAVATLFAALYLPRPLVEKCLLVLLAAGACQMLLAVLQFWMGTGSALYFGVDGATGLVGSFANRNHLADFLVMLMPVWFFWFGQSVAGRGAHGEARFGGASALWLFFGFALLVVALATLSRGALLSAALVLTASTLLLGVKLKSRLGRKQRVALGVAAGLFALLAVIGVGAERVGQRLDKATVEADAQTRQNFTSATLEGAQAFWPWGSGAGTYESVFPRFQAADSLHYVEYAHNDYAQLLMELGLAGVLLALVVAGLVGTQFMRLLRAYRAERRLSGELALRAWCGLGAAALLLHSTVEFNMHIPALALTAAFLLGVYLRPLRAARSKA